MKKKYTYLIILFLIVASFVVYGRILGNDFVNFDDNVYITGNNHIKSGINPESIKWAFSAVVASHWHPVTLLSLMMDWILFGVNASGYHLINLLLHIGSVLFLFFFLNRTTKNLWSSAFAAALFALHPLRVESVAWAAERKDVLSMFFGMASIYAYACYAESSKLSLYFLCLILFALGLMSKPMLVTLPFVLLLLDYWPLGRWQKVDTIVRKEISAPVRCRHLTGRFLWEKAPFIFLTIGSSFMTLWFPNKVDVAVPIELFPFPVRVANALISYVSYLKKIFWPVDLAVFYPYEHSFPFWQILISCFILIGITIFVVYYIKKLSFLFVGWFWYLGTLIPVIGLVEQGSRAMADRYTYLPSIGIAIMLAWGIPFLFTRADIRKKILFPAGIAVLAILAGITWQQCGYWKNSIKLWNHALQVTKNNDLAYNNRGGAYDKLGQYELAIKDYNEAIRLKPDFAGAYYNRGGAYAVRGRHELAIKDYNEAIRLKPDFASAYYNRGVVYDKLGQHTLAIKDYNEAIRLKPDFASAYYNRGVVYDKLGQYTLAIKDYNEAIRLKPDFADVYYIRGFVYNKLGQYALAIKDYNEAIRLKPDFADAYFNRGSVYDDLRQEQRAIKDYSEAIRVKPDYADAYNNRGIAYLNQGNNKLGCSDAQKTCALGNCKLLEMAKGKGACL
jgi:tetratricopeptide (TPR) repeat protein